MRRIIAIIDPDSEYAQKLASYINNHDSGGLKAVSFSGAESFKKLKDNYDTRMMLIDEHEILEFDSNDSGPGADSKMNFGGSGSGLTSITICLSEDDFAATHYLTINKYSGADTIMRFMLEKYTEVSKDVLKRTSINRSHMITVYSPVGRSGRTSFAITIAQYLGRESRCLLMSLDEYSGIFRYIAEGAQRDLSDVIYSYKQGRFSWAELERTVYRFGTADYIAPARYPEDLAVLGGEQMAELLDSISLESGYENIVLDLGSYGKRAAEILEMSNEVYMPTLNSALSRCKTDEFRHVLDESGRGDLIGRIKEVTLPFEERLDNALTREEDYSYGKLFEYTRDLFSDSGQSDQSADGYEKCQ